MKRVIALEYLKTIVFAVFASVLICILVCYFVFFNNQTVDNNMPQYLVRTMEQYIDISGESVRLDNEAAEKLDSYELWMQVVDTKGNVVYERSVPDGIPQHYTNFELVNYVLRSNQLDRYTIYAAALSKYPDYGVLLGCDSNLVTKYSYSLLGNGRNVFWKCLLVFLLVTTIVITVVSFRFSRKVTTPIGRALQDIQDIQSGRELHSPPGTNQKFFSDVFISIRKLQSALKKNEKLRAEWITNISHDIKTPLSVIKGYAELLGSENYEFEREELILYANQILQSEERIKELVEELKISQMLVEGKWNLKFEKVNLAELIKECIRETKTYIKGEPIINFTCEKEIEILADRKLLERCLVNIICNAYIHNEKDVCVEISLSDELDGIHIVISDNGKGIKQEDLEHIFERYYRGTDSGKVKGTGLGLAIAKEVIVAHGGEIYAASILGEGTKFELMFAHYH